MKNQIEQQNLSRQNEGLLPSTKPAQVKQQKVLHSQKLSGSDAPTQLPKFVHSTEFINQEVGFTSGTGRDQSTGGPTQGQSQTYINQPTTQSSIISNAQGAPPLITVQSKQASDKTRIPKTEMNGQAPTPEAVGSSRKLQQQIQIKNSRFHQRKTSMQHNQQVNSNLNATAVIGSSNGSIIMNQDGQPIPPPPRSQSMNAHQAPSNLAKSSKLLTSQNNQGQQPSSFTENANATFQNHVQISNLAGGESQTKFSHRPGSKSLNRQQLNNASAAPPVQNGAQGANGAKLGKTFFHPPTTHLTGEASATALKARVNSQSKFSGKQKPGQIGNANGMKQNDIMYSSQMGAEPHSSQYNRTSSLPNYPSNSGNYISSNNPSGQGASGQPNITNVLAAQKAAKFNSTSTGAVNGVAAMRQYASSIDRAAAVALQNLNNAPLVQQQNYKERKRSQQLQLNQNLQQSPHTVQANRQQKMFNHQQQQVAGNGSQNYSQQQQMQKANRKAFRATQQFSNMAKVGAAGNHSSVNVGKQFLPQNQKNIGQPSGSFNSTQNIRFPGGSAISLAQQQIMSGGDRSKQQREETQQSLLLNEQSTGDLNPAVPTGDYDASQNANSKSVQREPQHHGHRRHLQPSSGNIDPVLYTKHQQQMGSTQDRLFHNSGPQAANIVPSTKAQRSWQGKGQGSQNGRSSSLGQPTTGKSTSQGSGSLSTATKKKSSGDYFTGQHQSHQLSSATQIEAFPRGGGGTNTSGNGSSSGFQNSQKFVGGLDGANQNQFHSNKDFVSGQQKTRDYNQQLMAAYQAVQSGSKSMHPADFKVQQQMRGNMQGQVPQPTMLVNQQQLDNLNQQSKGKGMKNNQYLKLQIQNNTGQYQKEAGANFNSLQNTNKNRPPSKRKVRSTTNTGLQQAGMPANGETVNSSHKKHNSVVLGSLPTQESQGYHTQSTLQNSQQINFKGGKVQTESKIQVAGRKHLTSDGISVEQTDLSACEQLSSPDKIVSIASGGQHKGMLVGKKSGLGSSQQMKQTSQRRQLSQERDLASSDVAADRKQGSSALAQTTDLDKARKRASATPLLDHDKGNLFMDKAQMQAVKVGQGQQPNPQVMRLPAHLMMQDGGTGASMKRITFQPPDSTHTSNKDSQSDSNYRGGQGVNSYNLPLKQPSTSSKTGSTTNVTTSIPSKRTSSRQKDKGMTDAQRAKQFNTTGVINNSNINSNVGPIPEGSRLPVKEPKQKKEKVSISINITEEALRRGKLPTEVIARNIAGKKYNAKGLLIDRQKTSGSEKAIASPRVLEMIQISAKIRKAFKETEEAPLTTSEFYRAGKMLGRGAFGKVNLGMQKLTRKLVAIKSINKEYLSEEKQRNKVMHEVGILLRLRHESVVKLYETFETGRHIMLVMELCAGGDLLNFVRKRKKLTEECAKVLFKQIIDGLGYIHSKSIIHRDIKLDNILLDGKGNVKIADFGVSKLVQKGETMREHSGTPAYIAPEIIRDKGYKGFKADLWSAGVVLFALLYGTVPFKANNMKDLHQQIMSAKYNFKDTDVSEAAKDLITRLLNPDPNTRLGVGQVLKHSWMHGAEKLSTDIFNDEEKEVIRSEFTYNDPSRFIRNEKVNKDVEPWDCFTELNLDSMNQTLRNASTKSLILAPFNSSMSDVEEFFKESFKMAPIENKKSIMKFAARCRDQDRQYEINNNAELDNGVYHKFVYSSKDTNEDKPDNKNEAQEQLLSRNSSRANLNKGKGGVTQLTEESEDLTKPMNFKGKGPKKTKQFQAEREALKADLRAQIRRPDDHLSDEDPKYENSVDLDTLKLDADRVQILKNFGYPDQYVQFCIKSNEANYCSAGYYMLGIDQNY